MPPPSPEKFWAEIFPAQRPVIFKNCDLGDCVRLWTPEYLIKNGPRVHTGEEGKGSAEEEKQKPSKHKQSSTGVAMVSLHVCPEARMDFVNRNFSFRHMSFAEAVARASRTWTVDSPDFSAPAAKLRDAYFISPNEGYYMRSLGSDPRKEVADFWKGYPTLAKDFKLPAFAQGIKAHSTIFRLSSAGCQLWTHYDAVDNFLMHIRGRKRVVLFPPDQAENLYLPLAANSSSSPVLDIDNPDLARFPRFAKARQCAMEGILEPGDVLFLPAMWFHNLISLEFSVSINMFWRALPEELYPKRDLYGNADLLAGAELINKVHAAKEAIKHLPPQYQEFYLSRARAVLRSSQ